jgi:ATP-dependent DNA helicase DinG
LFNDSFKEYSIPKAVIKLKQWFGRLIRTTSDSGVVVFLDNRATNTSWGNSLLEAFPDDINIKKWSYKWLLNVLKK